MSKSLTPIKLQTLNQHFVHNLTICIRDVTTDKNLTPIDTISLVKTINEMIHHASLALNIRENAINSSFYDILSRTYSLDPRSGKLIKWAYERSFKYADSALDA